MKTIRRAPRGSHTREAPRAAAANSEFDAALLDVSQLPSYAFGPRGLMWWGTMGIIVVEATVFALAAVAYLYLRTNVDTWPPSVPPPELFWGTLNTAILLASVVPNHLAKSAAEAHDLVRVRRWLSIALAFAAAFLVVRAFELGSLNVSWYLNAYGSAVWALMILHTAHLATDFADSAVLAALMFIGPIEGKRFVDVAENGLYWDFVVIAWLPIYGIVYWGARLL